MSTSAQTRLLISSHHHHQASKLHKHLTSAKKEVNLGRNSCVLIGLLSFFKGLDSAFKFCSGPAFCGAGFTNCFDTLLMFVCISREDKEQKEQPTRNKQTPVESGLKIVKVVV